MRLGLSISAFLLCVSNAAWAKDVRLPPDKPALTLTLPDEWSPKAFENGYEATSGDGTVYVSFEAADRKDRKSLMTKSMDALAAKGVEIDTDSQKKDEGVMSSMKAVATDFGAKYKGSDTNVDLIVLFPSEEKVVLFTIWGSEQGKKANADAIDDIRKSIKSAN